MRLLILGPLEGYTSEAARIAHGLGAKVLQANSLDDGLAALRGGKGIDLVMIDVKLDVGRFIGDLRAERIPIEVVACGVGSDAQAAVKAIRAGASEYVPLPPNAELIGAVLAAASDDGPDLIARDPAMAAVVKLADRIAPSEATVLITGESGTGKEVMARYLHQKSRRAQAPFISVNCAAIPENLLESELFGHEKGAFTGAVARRIGRFEEANGGTLLLDEISEMDIRLQAKLLRALQERVIDRVGGTQPVKVDIRIIATSNRDMEAHVAAGHFREDLYFRLNVVTLELPPLRERPADIPAIAQHFVKKYAELNGVDERPLSAEAIDLMVGHSWRGNVRELENTVHRAVLLSPGEEIDASAIVLKGGPAQRPDQRPAQQSTQQSVTPAQAADHPTGEVPPADVPATAIPGDTGADPASAAADEPGAAAGTRSLVGRTVADVERDLILDTLHHTAGNRTHAATILGISIRTLRNKLKQYSDDGMAVPPPSSTDRMAI